VSEQRISDELQKRLRSLPAVGWLAGQMVDEFSEAEAIAAARAVLNARRAELLAGADDDPDLVARVRQELRPSLRRVLNATGVLLHTNLGRAPLSAAAIQALNETAMGYSNLELDLICGQRGSRHEHVRSLLIELTGAQDAIVVNNGAAAVLLAVAALADGRAVVVSRGQLVEIGGRFRIPEVLAQAGAPLVEVGTTNRTRLADYARALAETADSVVLRVHQSNFRTVGFVEDVAIEPLCSLGAPVIDDLGSGLLAFGVLSTEDEPAVRRSVCAGATLVCFSGDKLLGGPQAGVLVGQTEAIAACAAHPLARALRLGRLPLAALAATLAVYRDPERAIREIPVLSMLTVDRDVLNARAKQLAEAIGGTMVETVSRVGGGALPLLELKGPAVRIEHPDLNPAALARALRLADPPIVARVSEDAVLLDPRTLADTELGLAAQVVTSVLSAE
jgi:L-seryl-tRNA(Ser) seleniumtransferase